MNPMYSDLTRRADMKSNGSKWQKWLLICDQLIESRRGGNWCSLFGGSASSVKAAVWLLIGPLLLLLESCCCYYLIYCCCPQLVFIDQVPWAAIVPGLCPGESNLVFWSPRQSDLLSPLSLTNYILLPHHRWIEEIIFQVDSNYPQLHSFGGFSFGVKSQFNLVSTLNWNPASKIILHSLEI